MAAAWVLRGEVPDASRAGRDSQRYLELASDQPLGQMQLGEYLLARGQTAATIANFERAVSWDSASAALRHELAIAVSRTGRRREAAEALAHAVLLAPKEPQYGFALGLALKPVICRAL